MSRESWVRRISKIAVASCLVFASIQALVTLLGTARPKSGLQSDVVEFWATGKMLRAHQSPYDLSRIFQLERLEGVQANSARFSFGPPIALPLWLPFGYMSVWMAYLLWYAAQLLCLYGSARILEKIYSRRLGPMRWMLFLFAPVLFCERAGQLGIFFLFALLLFLASYRQRPFIAGACLAPLALKPHIVLPFACVLILWVVLERRWKILIGFIGALGVSMALSCWIAPHSWRQYSEMMVRLHVIDLPIPCLSSCLRRLLGLSSPWVQFLPSAVACTFAAAYYGKKRKTWSWENDGVLLLALGLVTAPYSWVMDESIAAPALASRLVRCRSSWPCLGSLALLNTIAVLERLAGVLPQGVGYLWTAPAWLLWCLAVDWFSVAIESPALASVEG
ncbi:MAG TPA: glycosyltransferase family 87 protein [Terracidiphilus sp.]|nr:glycosyltransferase family 87 protein [Terracidiphilus sp.]